MNNKTIVTQNFKEWALAISKDYRRAQIKAAIRVNSELLSFYYDLGQKIFSSSFKKQYGNAFYDVLSNELTSLLNEIRGFSPRTLRYCEKFYILYKDTAPNLQQLVAQLSSVPWGHHCIITDKCKKVEEALFYVGETVKNNWSRSVLRHFLDTDLYKRQGKAINNFENTLPTFGKDLANQITKDPYIFDFIECRDDYNEKELKDALINNIQKYLLELGTAFAFVGREYRLDIGDSELYADLLFYNIKVHAYVVIEVKTTNFKGDYVGQLGTYTVAVDHILKSDRDEKTIGLLVCKYKNEVLARYSLESSTQPIGVSSFELSKLIPEDYKSNLPTIEEIENELKDK